VRPVVLTDVDNEPGKVVVDVDGEVDGVLVEAGVVASRLVGVVMDVLVDVASTVATPIE
jgi:hypothetical protein